MRWLRFFAEYHEWDDELSTMVGGVDLRLRVACKNCRYRYYISTTAKQSDPVFDQLDEENILREPACQGWKGEYSQSIRADRNVFSHGSAFCAFYCGSCFDSRLAREEFSFRQLLGSLWSKKSLESEREKTKVSNKRSGPRFVYGHRLASVFENARRNIFPTPARAPVGLNPERFVAKCEGCQKWLLDSEYGVQFCEQCSERKPPAM
jgi:hypothetical protein